jgi:outer membrane protein TolC
MALQTGRTSTILSALTSPQSLFFQINAQLVQTLFDNGNKAMGVDLSMNRQLELTHRYAYTVLTALREVENGLISVAYTSQKVNALQDARLEATALAALSSRVVELGGIDFVQLLQIQEAVYSAESSAIIGRLDLLQAWIDLYKSLGGGLKIEANTCPGGKRLNSISNITSQGATKQSILNGAPLP